MKMFFIQQLLMGENLDLKLNPYKVLATSSKHGFVQFIESTPVAEVIDKDGSIIAFLRKHGPAENGPLGVAPEVMDNYIRSCGELLKSFLVIDRVYGKVLYMNFKKNNGKIRQVII